MRACLLTLALLLATAVSHAEEAGRMEIIVVPTIQYAHQDVWAKTPGGRAPKSTAVGNVVRGQAVHILVFATRFSVGPDQQAEVSYRVTFIRPDGATGSSTERLKLVPRGPVKEPRHVFKAPELAGFVATPDEPLGTWGVVVEATDLVAGATVRREQKFTVVGDEGLTEPLPPGLSPGHWLMAYHDKPAPQQLLAATKLAAENPPAGARPIRDAENGTWLGFFEQVLADNPWLLPQVVARLDRAAGRERELLATCLAYAKRNDRAFHQTLPENAREAFMLRRLETWPAPTMEPLNGAQLDVLWGRFFASGSYEPIRALVAVLGYHPYKDALEEYKQLKEKPARPPTQVLKGIVFQAAVWSLRSNIEQDKVVRDYCEGILLREELPETETSWLAGLFKAAMEKLKRAEGRTGPAAQTGE